MDAIESGLVKVPRVPVDDDSKKDETIWRKLYANTSIKKLRDYIETHSSLPAPLYGALDAVVDDWKEKLETWQEGGQPTPPVLILVVNNIANAVALYRHLAGRGGGREALPRSGT